MNGFQRPIGAFFRQTRRPGIDTNGGARVDDCTHTFSCTGDHACDPAPGRQLAIPNPAEALAIEANALFSMEAAFGR